ncbi:MAG: RNA methyltransferase [Rikenellaceae bacterium]|nr:RNA methyltransferase [Rikenellaceae bacterium]
MKKTPNDELGRLTAEEFALARKIPVAVILDGIRSLNNVGSVFRTCDAFAVEKLYLCGITATPPDREIHKTALGAENTVPWEYYRSAPEAIGHLRDEGYNIVAVEQAEGSVPLQGFECPEGGKFALIFGNEVFGVSDGCMALCDGAVEIPQAGTKHSLNIAVAAGIVLWHFFRSIHIDG